MLRAIAWLTSVVDVVIGSDSKGWLTAEYCTEHFKGGVVARYKNVNLLVLIVTGCAGQPQRTSPNVIVPGTFPTTTDL